jgi:hypothetical protein
MIKSLSNKWILLIGLLSGLLIIPAQSQAAMVNFTLTGEIITADVDNPFNLVAGGSVSVSGTYDDSPIGSGVIYIEFSTSINNMLIQVGNTHYTDSMDVLGGASLYFNNGVFDGLDYRALDDSYISWGVLGDTDPGGNLLPDFSGTGIEGNWVASSFTVTPVPVPGAVWLFGTGLLLLSQLARRNKSTA